MKSRNNPRRIAPSIRLKTIRPPSAGSIFLSSVAASNGTYLYMKMKKPSESRRFPTASQLLTVAAFSRDWEEEEEDFGDWEGSSALRAGGTAEAAVTT